MKKVFTLLMMLVAFTCFSQNQETSSEPIDSGPLLVETPADTSAFSLETGLSIYTRYFWRGVKFGSGPSLQGLMEFSHKKRVRSRRLCVRKPHWVLYGFWKHD